MMTRRRLIAVAACVLSMLAGGMVAIPGLRAQQEPAPTDPQLFDLNLAQRELASLERRITELQIEIADAIDTIDGMTVSRDFIELNSGARADALFQARTDARNMAVDAFVGIGAPLSGFDLLDAQTVSDVTWWHALMRQQADRLSVAADTYAVLAGESDDNVLILSDAINAENRQLEALNRELARVVGRVPRAEYFVSIAEIHAEANAAFEQSGRAEPSAEQWRQLRFCESTETYAIDTGNTFYGAYQFTWETWGTVGGEGNPALATPAEQDARARLLYARRGHQPWPICGRYLR